MLPTALLRYLEQFPSVEIIDHAADVLSALARYRLPNPDLTGTTAHKHCCNLLVDNPTLRDKLLQCHTSGDYTELWDIDVFQSLATYRLPETQAIEKDLEEVDPDIRDTVFGETNLFRTWTPDSAVAVDEAYSRKLTNERIPQSFNSSPLLPIHGLGTLSEKLSFRDRLGSVFRTGMGNHVFLVNSSGSGKTRILYEGLSMHWGIYFTCAIDSTSLGSGELLQARDAFAGSRRDFSTSKASINTKLARRLFAEVLLANLVLMRHFVKIMDEVGMCTDHKRRWLLLKLAAGRLFSIGDPFCLLQDHLKSVSNEYISGHISRALQDIRTLCRLQDEEPLFLVLDECNVASRWFLTSFDDEAGQYPLLKEILRSWVEQTQGFNVTIVCAGTRIPRTFFKYEADEWRSWSWSSNTGCFDNPLEHREYFAKYVPDDTLASESGKQLLIRMFRWLRGRHRATAAPITLGLNGGFHSPHSRLNDFVHNYTTFQPQDGVEFATREPPLSILAERSGLESQSFYGIEADPLIRFTVHEILLYFLVTGQHPLPFGPDRVELVSLDVGRFEGPNADVVMMDEPLSVVASAAWLTGLSASLWDFTYLRSAEERIPQRPHCVAPYIALYLLHAFASKRPLSEIFTFTEDVPAFAKQTAEVVVLHSQKDGGSAVVSPLDISGIWTSPTPLATSATSDGDMERWLSHEQATAFCIPPCDAVDLLFVIRLKDYSLLWVAVSGRVAWEKSDITFSDVADMLKQSRPEHLFKIKKDDPSRGWTLENACTSAGPYAFLRVVASFPAVAGTDDIPEGESAFSPFAAMNPAIMDEIMSGIKMNDALQGIIHSVLGDREPLAPSALVIPTERTKAARNEKLRSQRAEDGSKIYPSSVARPSSPTQKKRKGSKQPIRASKRLKVEGKGASGLPTDSTSISKKRTRAHSISSPTPQGSPQRREDRSGVASSDIQRNEDSGASLGTPSRTAAKRSKTTS